MAIPHYCMIISFLCSAYTVRFLVFDQPTQYDEKKKKQKCIHSFVQGEGFERGKCGKRVGVTVTVFRNKISYQCCNVIIHVNFVIKYHSLKFLSTCLEKNIEHCIWLWMNDLYATADFNFAHYTMIKRTFIPNNIISCIPNYPKSHAEKIQLIAPEEKLISKNQSSMFCPM